MINAIIGLSKVSGFVKVKNIISLLIRLITAAHCHFFVTLLFFGRLLFNIQKMNDREF